MVSAFPYVCIGGWCSHAGGIVENAPLGSDRLHQPVTGQSGGVADRWTLERIRDLAPRNRHRYRVGVLFENAVIMLPSKRLELTPPVVVELRL